MSSSFERKSAKIYRFPSRVEANASAHRRAVKSDPDPGRQMIRSTEFGSGWYHDAAIQSEQPRKL